MAASITYDRLDSKLVTYQDAADINALLPQLTTMEELLLVQELRTIADRSLIFVARERTTGKIVGTGTLHIHHKLTERIGTIEDVVVDASLCGHGIGTGLMKRLIGAAMTEYKLKKLSLTSKPDRVAANRLYQKLGFELRETNHYRMNL